MDNKIITVFGSPSSGKTLTAVKLGKLLNEKKKNVIVLLCDHTAPMLPVIYTRLGYYTEKSLANVLNAELITSDLITANLITDKKYRYLSFLGFAKGQNALSYADFSVEKALDLLLTLKYMCDYVIVDASSDLTSDNLAIAGLNSADKRLSLITFDLKGYSYYASQSELFNNESFAKNFSIIGASIKENCAKEEALTVLGGCRYFLPYVEGMDTSISSGEMLTKTAKAYEKELGRIADEVIAFE